MKNTFDHKVRATGKSVKDFLKTRLITHFIRIGRGLTFLESAGQENPIA